MLPVSVPQSSSGTFTIGCIANRWEGIFSPLTMQYNTLAAKWFIQSPITSCSTRDHTVAAAFTENGIGWEGGDGSAQRGQSVIYEYDFLLFKFNSWFSFQEMCHFTDI